MTPAIAVSQPVLVYTRIAQNRRKTLLLVALSVAALLPFVGGISYLVSLGIMHQVSPSPRATRARIEREEEYFQQFRSQVPDEEREEFDARFERRIAKERADLVQEEAEDPGLMLKLMLVIGTAVTAALGLLFWGIISSPTAKLLVQAGAQPAGSNEAAAARLLENLAIGAGLPTPKLYVIEASAPNAFAAGMHPDHAVVAVTRGALNLLDQRELEGVLAHELSHIGNHDIRLNAIAASVALFLRIPYLLFRRQLSAGWSGESGSVSSAAGFVAVRRGIGMFELLVSPLGLYILFAAPLVGTLARAARSREREFLADADAALLTRFPEGLMRALAKIGGSGSSLPASNPAFAHFYFADPAVAGMSWFGRSLLATHPPLEDRIQRLAGFEGATAVPTLEAAVEQGKRYAHDHPTMELVDDAPGQAAPDELASLNQGNPMGRVFRVADSEPVPVYEAIRPGIPPLVCARIKPGALIVAFDDAGKMRQVNTADETFGYIARSVKLVPLENVIPAEIYDPKTRAALEAKLPPLDAVAVRATPQAMTPKSGALTTTHIIIAVVVFVVVLVGALVVLKFAQ